jgi:hypothetical protein
MRKTASLLLNISRPKHLRERVTHRLHENNLTSISDWEGFMPVLKLKYWRCVGVIGIAGIALLMASLSGTFIAAQTAAESTQVPEWQKAAGGKRSFEVASIKPATPGKFTPSNFTLDFLDSFAGNNPHGRFVAQLWIDSLREVRL